MNPIKIFILYFEHRVRDEIEKLSAVTVMVEHECQLVNATSMSCVLTSSYTSFETFQNRNNDFYPNKFLRLRESTYFFVSLSAHLFPEKLLYTFNQLVHHRIQDEDLSFPTRGRNCVRRRFI